MGMDVIPKFFWNYELYCAGESYEQEKIEITQQDAHKIFQILRQYSRALNPPRKMPKEKNKKTLEEKKKKNRSKRA